MDDNEYNMGREIIIDGILRYQRRAQEFSMGENVLNCIRWLINHGTFFNIWPGLNGDLKTGPKKKKIRKEKKLLLFIAVSRNSKIYSFKIKFSAIDFRTVDVFLSRCGM